MPTSAGAAHSNAALLIAVQSGNHALSDEFYRRFTPRIVGMIRSLRPDHQHAYVGDVLGTTMLMLIDPKVKRFISAEGTLVQYLFRRVKNAIKRTDYEYRPACINRRVKPKQEKRPSRYDAATVYDNTTRARTQPMPDTGFIDREAVDLVMSKAAPDAAKIAHLRYVMDYPMTEIARSLGIDRFAVARRLKRFRDEASHLLASAMAA